MVFVNVSGNDEEKKLTGEAAAKEAIESYIVAVNKADAKKIMKCIDIKGTMAWQECDEDGDYFLEAYKDVDDEDVKEYEEIAQESMESMCESIEEDYKEYSIKVKKIKEVEKLAKDLYSVKAQLEVKTMSNYDEAEEDTDTLEFIVYKDKIISEAF